MMPEWSVQAPVDSGNGGNGKCTMTGSCLLFDFDEFGVSRYLRVATTRATQCDCLDST